MTVPGTSSGMSTIREENETESPGIMSPVSFPTEYNQSFRSRNTPRPRNPVSGWQARNLSNILPVNREPSPERARPLRRRPENYPWLQRQESQIFPLLRNDNQNQADRNRENNVTPIIDENNNIQVGRPRRRPQWPWQARAQTSSIFMNDVITTPPDLRMPQTSNSRQASASKSNSRSKQWPWQERARKSVIFDILTSGDKEKAKPKHRKYDWDQRQSSSVKDCVQQQKLEEPSSSSSSNSKQGQGPSSASSSGSASSLSHQKKWPWQKRAMESVIFKSPDKVPNTREVKFAWDQRKTRFSVKLDPCLSCPQRSSYSDNYVKWQKTDRMKPAGKPCYKDEDIDIDTQKRTKTGKRRIPSKPRSTEKKKSSSILLALPAPPEYEFENTSPKSSPSIEGSSCLELVPADFDFHSGTTPPKKRPSHTSSSLKKLGERETTKINGNTGNRQSESVSPTQSVKTTVFQNKPDENGNYL